MPFKITDTYLFWWPVTVRMPDPDKPGEILPQSFEMRFEALGADEADALDKSFDGDVQASIDFVEREKALLRRIAKDWRGVESEDGGMEGFSALALDRCLQHSWFRAGVYAAYAQAMRGEGAHADKEGDPRTKN